MDLYQRLVRQNITDWSLLLPWLDTTEVPLREFCELLEREGLDEELLARIGADPDEESQG